MDISRVVFSVIVLFMLESSILANKSDDIHSQTNLQTQANPLPIWNIIVAILFALFIVMGLAFIPSYYGCRNRRHPRWAIAMTGLCLLLLVAFIVLGQIGPIYIKRFFKDTIGIIGPIWCLITPVNLAAYCFNKVRYGSESVFHGRGGISGGGGGGWGDGDGGGDGGGGCGGGGDGGGGGD